MIMLMLLLTPMLQESCVRARSRRLASRGGDAGNLPPCPLPQNHRQIHLPGNLSSLFGMLSSKYFHLPNKYFHPPGFSLLSLGCFQTNIFSVRAVTVSALSVTRMWIATVLTTPMSGEILEKNCCFNTFTFVNI